MAEKPIRVQGWPLGVDNRAPDHALPEGALRNAINVDILADGRIRRRKGFTSALAGNYHSLQADDGATFGLAVRDGTLRRLTRSGSALIEETVATGLMLHRHMSYADINGQLYYSNGLDSGKVGMTGAVQPWAVETPTSRPSAAASGAGLLAAGQYQVAVSFITAAMEESTYSPPPVVVSVPTSNAGIALAGIPQPLSAGVAYIRIYCSTANGTILFRVADLPVGVTAFTIQSAEGVGRSFRAGNLLNLPAGDLIAHYNGRLYSAVGSVLWESEPFSYGLCNLAEGFTQFPADITLIAPVMDGLYVAADRTYFLAGTSAQKATTMRAVLPYGAVKYAVAKRHDNDAPIWLSQRGICQGGDGGQVTNMQEEHIATPAHDEGSILFREQDGIKQIIGLAAGQQGQVAKLAASDFADAEIRRGGTSSLREQADAVSLADVADGEVVQ